MPVAPRRGSHRKAAAAGLRGARSPGGESARAPPRSPGAGPAPEPDDPLKAYRDPGSLRGPLESGAVKLVRGDWLLRFSTTPGARLPRQQEMPAEAVWAVEDLFRGDELRVGRAIVAVSHCWRSREHPDPNGDQLQLLGQILKQWTSIKKGLIESRVAIFFDWCSLAQEPRSEEEVVLWSMAMEGIGIWYAHEATSVWMLTSTPPGTTPYHRRGWPHLEALLSSLITPRDEVLDFGRRESGVHHYERGWPTTETAMSTLIAANCDRFDESTHSVCMAPRLAPLTPRAFERMQETLVFGERSDCHVVAMQYRRAFEAVASSVDVLDCRHYDWGNEEAQLLSDVLPSFAKLRELNLANNYIGDLGAAALAEAIPDCPSLRQLFIYDNEIEEGLEGPERLIEAWRSSGKDPRWCWLAYPTCSEYVLKKLSQ